MMEEAFKVGAVGTFWKLDVASRMSLSLTFAFVAKIWKLTITTLRAATILLENGNLTAIYTSRCPFETKKEIFCDVGLTKPEWSKPSVPIMLP